MSPSTPYRNVSLGVTGQVVKATPGTLTALQVYNNAAGALFIKVYDKATAPTGADTPVLTVGVGANAGERMVGPIAFTAGIAVRATTVATDADASAPAANQAIVNLFYR